MRSLLSHSGDPSAVSLEQRDVSGDSELKDPTRFWSRDDCETLFKQIVSLTNMKGDTSVLMRLSYISQLRWARNRPISSSIVRKTQIIINRLTKGGVVQVGTNQVDESSLKQVIAEAEQSLPEEGTYSSSGLPSAQQYLKAPIWSDTTFNVTRQTVSDLARTGNDPVMDAKLFAAGNAEVRTETWAIFNTKGLAAHAAGTMGYYAETVYDPEGSGASGWAGKSHTDWSKLDVAGLAKRALDKGIAAMNPRAVEPGRYTTILEPEAVFRFMYFTVEMLDLLAARQGGNPYSDPDAQDRTKLGQKVMDSRITISTDPMDPDCSYIPFDGEGYPYKPVTWIENGVLKNMAYDVTYAREKLQQDLPLSNPYAFRMSGGESSVEDMIATTERGILVNRLDIVRVEDPKLLLVSTATRDGAWLIERGKITCPVKNMRIMESPMYIANKVLQLGKPERVCAFQLRGGRAGMGDNPYYPVMAFAHSIGVVPPMKVEDFNFFSLLDAV